MQAVKTGIHERHKNRARVLKALAHPARLGLVEELAAGERCVCDLAARIGVELSTVSRHLSLLRTAGLLEDEKRGTQVFYRLRAPCVLRFFECLAELERAQRQEELFHAA
jgi:ArsR family transcriptional regulator